MYLHHHSMPAVCALSHLHFPCIPHALSKLPALSVLSSAPCQCLLILTILFPTQAASMSPQNACPCPTLLLQQTAHAASITKRTSWRFRSALQTSPPPCSSSVCPAHTAGGRDSTQGSTAHHPGSHPSSAGPCFGLQSSLAASSEASRSPGLVCISGLPGFHGGCAAASSKRKAFRGDLGTAGGSGLRQNLRHQGCRAHGPRAGPLGFNVTYIAYTATHSSTHTHRQSRLGHLARTRVRAGST